MESNNDIIPGFDNDRDDSLTINLRRADGVKDGLFIYLSGYIDTYNSSFFQKKITNVIEAGYINLIFNCSSLNYVSSTGIGSFTVFLKKKSGSLNSSGLKILVIKSAISDVRMSKTN